VSIDPEKKRIRLEDWTEESYDKLIVAAGASSFLPPVLGSDAEGVFTLRTIHDALRIIEFSQGKKDAVVIGAGLLGIEAAVSLTLRGLRLTIVEVFDRLLPRQLEAESAAILQRLLEKKNLSFLLPRQLQSISKQSNGRLRVSFNDGDTITADMALFSAGVRPNLKIVEGSGIETGKGIKVNDFLQTSADSVYAAGDIAEHRGIVYGLWPPAREQGLAAGNNASGVATEYTGSVLSTKLKVAGIDLVSLGTIEAGTGTKELTKQGPDTIRKFFVREDKIVGAILLGDIARFQVLQETIKKGKKIDDPGSLL
jgi:nitrite reductase (NADH) large subunit